MAGSALDSAPAQNAGDGRYCGNADAPAIDADLERVRAAWPTLPPAIRAAVLALVAASE